MSEFKKIQEIIQNYIRKGDVSAFDYVTHDNEWASERLQIYRNSYFLRLIEQLENEYPKLAVQLGQVAFGQVVHDYMTAVPSTHYSIHEVGHELPLFMKNALTYDEALVALACMEAALSAVLCVENEPVLTGSALQALSSDEWAAYHFQLIKAHQIVSCHPDIACHFDLNITESVLILVWQRQDKAHYQVLSENDAYLINYFAQGLDFTEVCEKMSQHLSEEQGVSFIFQRIQYWLNQGIFSDH